MRRLLNWFLSFDPPQGYLLREEKGWGWIAYQQHGEALQPVSGPRRTRWSAAMAANIHHDEDRRSRGR